MKGLILDAGALIAIERGHRDLARRIRVTREQGDPILIPAGCWAQVWRDPSRQVELARLLKRTTARMEPLDRKAARQVGELLARSETTDVIDAHVAVVALRSDATVVTSDPDDIQRLAPRARIVRA